MKVIFLDVDGVLNSNITCTQFLAEGKRGYGGWFKEEDVATHDNILWGQELVNNLFQILLAVPEAKIVISSTWRHGFSVEKFIEMFN